MSRTKSGIVALLVLCFLSGVVPSFAHATGQLGSMHPAPKLRGTVVWPAGTRPVLSFALRDQNGHLLTQRSIRNHVAVITFLDAHCTSACPVTGRELALTQRDLGGAHSPLMMVIIDVDPWKDTPTGERAFVHKVGLVGNWHWLSGSRAQLANTWRVWGTYVRPARREIIHTAAVYLADQKGYVRVADEIPLRPDWLAESVRALLAHPTHKG